MMKKLLLAIFVLATSIAVNAQEPTDMSTRDNGLYIPAKTVKAGATSVVLSFCMKNADEVQTIGSYILFPEGVTVCVNAKSKKPLFKLSTERTDAEFHSASSNVVDGVLRVGILQTSGLPFDYNDGEIATITVDIASDMKPGDYLIKIYNQEFSSLKPKVIPEDTYCKLTVEDESAVTEVSADNGSEKPAKYVKNGKVVILKNNKEYNANGSQLK